MRYSILRYSIPKRTWSTWDIEANSEEEAEERIEEMNNMDVYEEIDEAA